MLIGSRKKRDSQIFDLVYVDILTGLNNRLAIYERIEKLISIDNNKSFYLILFDIDNFKNVNDIFGHDMGDAILAETGYHLRGYFDSNVQVGRLGGDEFVLIVTNQISDYMIIDCIENIRNVFKESLKLSNHSFHLTISIGVAKYPAHGKTKEELIKKADIALYEAKNTGKNKYVFFNIHMDTALREQIKFQDMIHSAFINDEFELYYQPLVRTCDHTILGFEALIRWNSKSLGWVSPYRLITVSEETGLIIPLGEWIFTNAIKFAKTICAFSKNKVIICINISTMQLAYSGFYEFVMDTIYMYGIDPSCICFEMTETVFLEQNCIGIEVLDKLSNEGFQISLDDFGTGYSSLSYLKNIKINYLKIDKCFIENILSNAYDRNLVELVIGIAKQKSAFVVGEGVESKEQKDLLCSLSCDIIQGYYISKPLPAKNVMHFLQSKNERY